MEVEQFAFLDGKTKVLSRKITEQNFGDKRDLEISIEQFDDLLDFIEQLEEGIEPYHFDYSQLYKLAIKSDCKSLVKYFESDSFEYHSFDLWNVALKFKRVNLLKKSNILLKLFEAEERTNQTSWSRSESQSLKKDFINYLDSDRTVLASKWLSCQGLNNSWGDETYFMFKACSDFDDRNRIHRKFIKDVCWTNVDFNMKRLYKMYGRLSNMKEEGKSVDRMIRKVESYLQYEFGYSSSNSDSD